MLSEKWAQVMRSCKASFFLTRKSGREVYLQDEVSVGVNRRHAQMTSAVGGGGGRSKSDAVSEVV